MEIHNQDNILDNDLMLINFRVKQFYLMPFFSEPTVLGIQEGTGGGGGWEHLGDS